LDVAAAPVDRTMRPDFAFDDESGCINGHGDDLGRPKFARIDGRRFETRPKQRRERRRSNLQSATLVIGQQPFCMSSVKSWKFDADPARRFGTLLDEAAPRTLANVCLRGIAKSRRPIDKPEGS